MPSQTMSRHKQAPVVDVSLDEAEHQRDIINRLRRIEGQARGLIEMIRNDRSCEDVALQMSAMRKAMDKAFYRMVACNLMETVRKSDGMPGQSAEVEQATRLLERFG